MRKTVPPASGFVPPGKEELIASFIPAPLAGAGVAAVATGTGADETVATEVGVAPVFGRNDADITGFAVRGEFYLIAVHTCDQAAVDGSAARTAQRIVRLQSKCEWAAGVLHMYKQRIVCHSFRPPAPTKGYCIAGCEDGPFTHALALLDGVVVHDPEPPELRRGQPWQITSVHVLAPANPAGYFRSCTSVRFPSPVSESKRLVSENGKSDEIL
jgi:hypothetical protein